MIPEKIYLIDFSNLYFVYYYIKKANFLPYLLEYISSLIKDKKGLILFFKDSGSSYKTQIYDKYKANRPSYDNTILKLKSILVDTLLQHGISIISMPNMEADSLISSAINILDRKFPQSKLVIVSNDYDFLQLVDYKKIFVIAKRYMFGLNFWTDGYFLGSKYISPDEGFLPAGSAFLLFRIINGDRSDNIGGLKIKNRKRLLKKIFCKKNFLWLQNLVIRDFDSVLNALKDYVEIDSVFNQLKLNYDLISLISDDTPNPITLDFELLESSFVKKEKLNELLISKYALTLFPQHKI